MGERLAGAAKERGGEARTTLKCLTGTPWKNDRYRPIIWAMCVLPRAGNPTRTMTSLSSLVPAATSGSTGLSVSVWPPDGARWGVGLVFDGCMRASQILSRPLCSDSRRSTSTSARRARTARNAVAATPSAAPTATPAPTRLADFLVALSIVQKHRVAASRAGRCCSCVIHDRIEVRASSRVADGARRGDAGGGCCRCLRPAARFALQRGAAPREAGAASSNFQTSNKNTNTSV
jgi:hypothetical protein